MKWIIIGPLGLDDGPYSSTSGSHVGNITGESKAATALAIP